MRILLTTLNSKYVHSNLALKYLYQVTVGSDLDVTLEEYTINNEYAYVYGEILKGHYDMVCFSTYIWNVEHIKRLGRDLKAACPDLIIEVGGPEVSYDADEFLRENPWADMVIRGEGELPFFQLCRELVMERRDLSKVSSLTYREVVEGEDVIRTNPLCPPVALDKIPFPYRDMEVEGDKVVYFESSRGCPYRCSYCISSIDKSIRALSLEKTFERLDFFLERGVRQVKFIDRTFNFDGNRAYEIWKHLIESDNGLTNFHFEICAEIIEGRHIDLIRTARPGLFQFEIGIQTTNPRSLRAVNRSERLLNLFENVERLIDGGNCHIHVDLIAGLPYEDMDSFRHSFNKVYSLKADDLQLGFLKVLKGTKIYGEAEEFQYKFRDYAPYEIISNKFMSAEELVDLKQVEKVLDLYYNRGGFSRTVDYLDCATAETSFDFYRKLATFYYERGFQHRNHKKEDLYRILYSFGCEEAASQGKPEVAERTRELLEEDLRATMNQDAIKKFIKKGWEI